LKHHHETKKSSTAKYEPQGHGHVRDHDASNLCLTKRVQPKIQV